MPETNTVDEVTSTRTQARGPVARPVQDDVIGPSGVSKVSKAGIEEENFSAGDRRGRVLKDSTKAMLETIEKDERAALASHEEGDADEDEPADDAAAGEDDDGAAGGDADEGGEVAADAEGDAEGGDEEAAPDPTAEWQTKAATLEQRNRELISELDTARKTPKSQRTERETALVAAESAYVEEGSVPALRKFLAVIVGAAPDSKEVDAELAGIYTDLTARELGVSLDQNQQALRDNARTRLLLARDKREKAEAAKKPDVDDSADAVQYENAAKHVDNLLVTKGQSGTSIADEYPMLMNLAEDFDGFKPGEVLARAIRQEIMTGTLDPKTSDIDMVRLVAPKIEQHYDAVAKRIEAARAKKTKTGTTIPSGKPKAVVEAATETRKGQAARTITNTTASRAPATPPKTTKQKAAATEKTRKDFKSDTEWRRHLLDKHFKS